MIIRIGYLNSGKQNYKGRKAYAFFGGYPRMTRIKRIIAAFCGVRRLCRLKKAAKQLSIRVIRVIRGQKTIIAKQLHYRYSF
jgi:hypothetical protein